MEKYREIFIENLKAYMHEHRMSQAALAEHLQVNRSVVGSWLSGARYPRMNKMERLASIFGVQKSDLVELHSAKPAVEKPKKVFPSSSYRFWDVGISAGAFEEIEGVTELPTVDVPDELLGRWAGNRNIMFMRVNGESMNNVIEDGAIIAVLSEVERGQIKNGDIVVASIDRREYTVKRFFDVPEERCIILRPDSSDPSFRELVWNYDDEDGLYILGKVVIYQVYM